MKNLLSIIIIFLFFNFSFSQKNEKELLKEYKYYIEENIGMGKWKHKYFLKDGNIIIEKTYEGNELTHRQEYEYDNFNNVKTEIETYSRSEGKVYEVSNINSTYKDSLLIEKNYDFGLTYRYSDFNELGKPKLIERIDDIFPSKTILEYDSKGNIIKKQELSTAEDDNKNTINIIETFHYKYDNQNNISEIHWEYEPKDSTSYSLYFVRGGGPTQYEHEYYRYKYKKNGLWTKKYKKVNGKEWLVARRKFKK